MSAPIRVAAPATIPHERPSTPCRPSCCKTPYGHSAAATNCICHEGDPMADHVPITQLRKLTARDGHHCIWTATETERLVPQHRQGGMGGRRDKHFLPRLVWLDSIVNGLIESDPVIQTIAKAWGIKISIHANPEQIPVFRPHVHTWFLLQGDARREISSLEALDRMHGFYGDEFFAWKTIADERTHADILATRGR